MRLFANEIRRLTKQVLLPLRLIKPFRIVVTLRLIIDSGLQKGSMQNHTNSVPRAHLLFSAHCTSLPYQNHVGHSDSKKNTKEIPKAQPSANIGNRISNIHESTRRFNVASPKNTQRTLTVRPQRTATPQSGSEQH
jgi:hypothetical protein